MSNENSINKKLSHPMVWCFSTYFAEGFPYSIIRTVSGFFFRTMNVSLESIGLTSFFGLPWVLKFLWAPQVDRYITKRWWLLTTQCTLAALFILCGFLTPLSWGVQAVSIVFLIGAVFAATHDIAIDGYYLVVLNSEEQSKYVGYRVLAYRCALMAGTGIIATIGAKYGWSYAFVSSGVVLGLLTLYHYRYLPENQSIQYSRVQLLHAIFTKKAIAGTFVFLFLIISLRLGINSSFYISLQKSTPFLNQLNFPAWINIFLFGSLLAAAVLRKRIAKQFVKDRQSYYSLAFTSFMEQEKIGILLAIIIFLRTGEILLSNMSTPFMVDCGLKNHFGWITATVGLPSSIAGALLGGYLIYHFSFKRMIVPFLLLQNGTNLLYMWLAFRLQEFVNINTGIQEPMFIGAANLAIVAGVHGFDQFAGGLGTSVLMTFLMRICNKGEFKAAHYAIGSGLMNLSGIFAGSISGLLAANLGYGWFFGLSFVAAVPGMIMLLPYKEKL